MTMHELKCMTMQIIGMHDNANETRMSMHELKCMTMQIIGMHDNANETRMTMQVVDKVHDDANETHEITRMEGGARQCNPREVHDNASMACATTHIDMHNDASEQCITMQVVCATTRVDVHNDATYVQQTLFTDRQCKVPAGNLFSADRFNFVPMDIPHCRWQSQSAGGDPLCPRVEAGLRTGRKGVLIADLPRSYPSSRAETTPVMTDMWPSAPSQDLEPRQQKSGVRTVATSSESCRVDTEQSVSPLVEARFMATQSSEEIVVMKAALEQGAAPQNEAAISMSYPPRSPVVHPVWAPQLYRAREPTTFELMGMIGDLQRSVADLAYGMSASPPAAPYAGNFVPQEPSLLGRIVIELSQPEVASGYSHDMPTPTQTLDQAEARGKDKAKVDADPIEQLLWAVEALKVRGMNKQQTSAIVTKAVDDAFPTPIKGSSSQAENRDGPRHAQTIPVVPNPAPGKVQKAKVAPADPFASASGKNPQTAKYLPRGRRVFHDLHMPLSRALLILAKNGHLKPLEPRPLPKNLPATHDATLYCAYHQQSGHSTDGCSRLRHEVQDLIDNKVILPPTSGKPVTTQLLDFEGSDTASM
ncbi:hypothetical protein HYC85_029270 [Camellia sinensis]|uniref:Uncharacterized protein n=1 Tax=Camellia sinensis TaxID=4442 RepID=A0A7J7FXS1_CAMSI|nr:hypothetical protein HYC85_029270 [Camellia sinensis]